MKRIIQSRTGFLAFILLAAMAIFVIRLFQLQVLQHGKYEALAQQNQQRQFIIPATRGEIYMMDGAAPAPVVLNQVVYNVIADPAVVKDDERAAIISSLQSVAGGEIVPNAKELLNDKKSRYAVLARHISLTQAEALKKKDFAGVLYKQGTMRNYPEGALGAHVLGFVNIDGEGQYGVEQGLNKELKGSDGMLQAVTDVRNVPLAIGKDDIRIPPRHGKNIALSVDRNIQSYAEEALKRGVDKVGATEGSVLVMNPKNGEVLAMANTPSYNPAAYEKTENVGDFMNTVTMVPYEPASVIKTFTMATGIDKGVITPQSTYYNTDHLQVADRVMSNAALGYTGTLTMQDVLNHSLNTGTITVARRLGDGAHVNLQARQTMYDYFHNHFGLGQKTGIEVGEVQGNIFLPDSAEGNEVRYSAMTYGQSLNVTMIQVASGFCSVVNGGTYYRPTVVHGEIANGHLVKSEHKPVRQTVQAKTSQDITQMLITARRSYFGARNDKKGYNIGGKTGTAESVVDGKYTQKETVATYLGFGGTNEPEYVIMVRVAAPGKGLNLEGGLHAGPIFTDISNWMIDYLKIPPQEGA